MSAAPVFVVGAQRSGTTMLRLMLNAHPRIAIPFETGFIPEFYYRLEEYGDLSDAAAAARLLADIARHPHVAKGGFIENADAILDRDIKTYADLIAACFEEYARRRDKPRWGDKTPSHVTELDVLYKLFPDCRVVHVVRDGRDVATSVRQLEWGPNTILDAAQDWKWKVLLGRKVGSMREDQYLEVRYEDLVAETEAELRRICRFIDEPYDAAMLDYPATSREELPAGSLKWHRNSISAPNAANVGQWKRSLSVADRILFEQIAGETLRRFGYEREALQSNLRSRLKKFWVPIEGSLRGGFRHVLGR